MKLSRTFRSQSGSVLMTTLIMALLVGLVVSAVLFVTRQHSTMVARARVWNSEIPIAEAGIEEALAHLNSNPRSLATNGWAAAGTNFVKKRVFTNAYFYTLISSSREPVIVSVGYARVPLQTNYTHRTVTTTTRRTPPKFGIVAKGTIILDGTTYVDSFDSEDDKYSTKGLYDPAKRKDTAGVASVSSLKPAIATGAAKIYGFAATGPGGTVTGNVGYGDWLAVNNGLQLNHVSDDFNMAIMDVQNPASWNPKAPSGGNNGGNNFSYILTGNNDYEFASLSMNSGNGILVNGNVRVWVKGDLKMSSSAGFTINSGGSLELYVGGSVDMSGKPFVNKTETAGNCVIYGLPTCTSIKLTGDASVYARLYAPQADVRMAGDADFYGSMVGREIRISGKSAIHYDEALGRSNPLFQIVSWEER